MSKATILEMRDDTMVSNTGAIPVQRQAIFINHSFPNSYVPFKNLSQEAFTYQTKTAPLSQLDIKLHGWQKLIPEWKDWVAQMREIHGETWRRADIYDAIESSTMEIDEDNEFFLVLARRWYPETNSFVYTWGESSVTLEDIHVLGGYPVLGESISIPLNRTIPENDQAGKRLMDARRFLNGTRAKKVEIIQWIRIFKNRGNGFQDVAHEAFLVLWLSVFVFPKATIVVGSHVHELAIRLARGTRIALGPAVLASIYKDLSRLSHEIRSLDVNGPRKTVDLWSPIHLVLLWGWLRFPIGNQETANRPSPLVMQWRNVRAGRRANLDELVEDEGAFAWRPYEKFLHNLSITVRSLFRASNQWVLYRVDMEEDVETWVKFTRPSKLVGLDNTVKEYLPHRVARQFGIDQDIPSVITQDLHMPWLDYNRPVQDHWLYIPSSYSRAGVTTRYLEWWNRSKAIVT